MISSEMTASQTLNYSAMQKFQPRVKFLKVRQIPLRRRNFLPLKPWKALSRSNQLLKGMDTISLERETLGDSYSEVELPPGQGDSMILESVPYQFEPSEQEIQDYIQERREKSTLQDTSDAISGFSSNSQEYKCRLGVVGECMLQRWFQPVCRFVGWSKRFLRNLKTLCWSQSN